MDRSACVVARSAHWTLSTVTRTGPAETSSVQPVQQRGRAQLAGRRGHHAKPPPACFLAGPGQQQRFPRARFASDEQHPALALLRAVQQAEDGLELRPAPPHRAFLALVSHGIPQTGPPS